MLATQQRTIDGMSFTVSQLPAMRGLKMLNRLLRALGPAGAKLLNGVGAGVQSMDAGVLADAVVSLTERMTESELEGITTELLETATVDNRPLMGGFNVTMQGRIGTILKLLKFALEVNYGSFFGVLAEAAQAESAKARPFEVSNILRTSGPVGVSP